MATTPPLPPPPPLSAQGAIGTSWQRWFNTLRQSVVQASAPAPDTSVAAASAAALAVLQSQIADLQAMLATDTGAAAIAALYSQAALTGTDAAFASVTTTGNATVGGNLTVTGTTAITGNTTVAGSTTVTGAWGCNGAAAQGLVTLPASATDLPSALTLLNAIRTMVITNGQGR